MQLRIDLLQDQRSTLTRDQFWRGYKVGYDQGHSDRQEKLPPATADHVFRTHRRVIVEGIEVDEGMRDFLVAL